MSNTTTTTTTRWNRDERGSADRYQMRLYATRVMLALTGGACPITGLPFDHTTGEVDRVDPVKGYAPGNVILTSTPGNQSRGALQSAGVDLPGVARYVADVARASASVAVPTKAEAGRWWRDGQDTDATSAALEGPYGA